MYAQEIGRMPADPYGAAATGPTPGEPASREFPGSRGPGTSPGTARPGRNAARWARAATGPTPGPPPPCGMQNVLCRFRCDTSAPNQPGRARPTRAFRLAPSTYTWPPAAWTASQTWVTVSSNTPLVDGEVSMIAPIWPPPDSRFAD